MPAAERYLYLGTSDNWFILISKAEVFFFNQADKHISETSGKDFLLFTVDFLPGLYFFFTKHNFSHSSSLGHHRKYIVFLAHHYFKQVRAVMLQ